MTKYALVIGIQKYGRTGFGDLEKPAGDAEAIAQILEEYGDFNVKRLPEQWNEVKDGYEVAKTTLNSKDLGREIKNFFNKVGKNKALLYFSGHGCQVETNLGSKKGYLVTSDCCIDNVATQGISLDDLNGLILNANCSSLVVLLDCCHAGNFLEESLISKALTAFYPGESNYFFATACRGHESAYEGKEYSVFTDAILEALQSPGEDGRVRTARLNQLIDEKLRNKGQEPVVLKSGGEITLVSYPEKKAQNIIQNQKTTLSPIRMRVSDEYYIERKKATDLLQRFEKALQDPTINPLLFNIYGIGGVGKTTLFGRLKEAHADTADFLEVCFKKNDGIETPLKNPLELMRKLHQDLIKLLGVESNNDLFTLREQQFEQTLHELSRCSIDGENTSPEEASKIRVWFERSIWFGLTNSVSTSSKSMLSDSFGFGYSAFSTVGNDTENWQEWIQQRVRNHPATKDQPGLKALMLEPVSQLTQAFAESLIQTTQNRERAIILVLDTYEEAQSYLNQWLWRYLVEDTALASASVRIVVVGRKSLQTDEGWRKLNQDRKLLFETDLIRFDRGETAEYLKKIGIKNGGIRNNIYKVTQGLPYYLNWVREQHEKGRTLDFSRGNQAIAELLFQGLDRQRRKILQVVACCRWFDSALIRHLLKQE